MHQEYFSNLDQIEQSWRDLKRSGFSQESRDEFWHLCVKGKELFWLMRNEDIKQGFAMVKSVPSYERAVMLLEHEERYDQAIKLCEEANSLGIAPDWYSKRIERLRKQSDENE